MRLLNWFRDHPVALFVVAAAALGAWIAYDATRTPEPVASESEPRLVAIGPGISIDAEAIARDKLSHLKPGMTRVEVEGLLGGPLLDGISPIVIGEDGSATYQATYSVVPMPRRLPMPPAAAPDKVAFPVPTPARPPAGAVLTLEFDASVQGHPLRRVPEPAKVEQAKPTPRGVPISAL